MPKLALAALLAFSFAPVAHGQARIESLHGDWAVRCTFKTSQRDNCGITHRKRYVLSRTRVSIVVVKGRNGRGRLLRVVAPDSVEQGGGVTVRVDQHDIGKLPFVSCRYPGCIAQKALNTKQFEFFRSGKTVYATMTSKYGRDFNMSVSLKGFGEAFDNLP
jgi:invasion protein IalB